MRFRVLVLQGAINEMRLPHSGSVCLIEGRGVPQDDSRASAVS